MSNHGHEKNFEDNFGGGQQRGDTRLTADTFLSNLALTLLAVKFELSFWAQNLAICKY